MAIGKNNLSIFSLKRLVASTYRFRKSDTVTSFLLKLASWLVTLLIAGLSFATVISCVFEVRFSLMSSDKHSWFVYYSEPEGIVISRFGSKNSLVNLDHLGEAKGRRREQWLTSEGLVLQRRTPPGLSQIRASWGYWPRFTTGIPSNPCFDVCSISSVQCVNVGIEFYISELFVPFWVNWLVLIAMTTVFIIWCSWLLKRGQLPFNDENGKTKCR